jgi:solute carrier family 13 (sodium-dependent dicarboxylate transporter), member 2/3/5
MVAHMFRSIANFRALSFLSIALAIYAAARLLPVSAGLTPGGQAVLGVVFAGVVLWISEAVPLGQTALVVLVSLGTVPNAAGSVTFIGFASPVVFFLIGAVAIGAAVESSGLAERLAKLLVRGARGNPARLYAQMLASYQDWHCCCRLPSREMRF